MVQEDLMLPDQAVNYVEATKAVWTHAAYCSGDYATDAGEQQSS